MTALWAMRCKVQGKNLQKSDNLVYFLLKIYRICLNLLKKCDILLDINFLSHFSSAIIRVENATKGKDAGLILLRPWLKIDELVVNRNSKVAEGFERYLL
jgi:hypothetical protein